MIDPAFEILNQRGTPMFFSDVFANRPTAGIVGRIFISTDTYAFYRDTGSGWDLIGGPGSGTITGSGTANKITKFTGSSSIGDSIMTEGTGLITLTGSNSRFVVGGTDDGSSQLQTYYDGNTRWKFVAASDSPTDDADITGYKSRGTISVPTAIQSGDSITNYSGRGHNGTTFAGGGGFDIFAAENYSVGNNGTYIAVETTPIGSATNTYFHRFSANGGFNVGQNADPTTGYVFQASGNSIVQSGKLVINNASSDSHLQVVGTSAPSIRIDNAIVGATQRFVMGLATATNNFIQGSTAGDICISTASASPLLFGMWQTINASEVMRISTSNNLLLGSKTDNGNRLQVTGNAYFSGNVGVGTLPSAYYLEVKGGNANTLKLNNDGSQFVQILFERNSVDNTGGDILLDGTNQEFKIRTLAPYPLVFSTSQVAGNPVEKMRLTPAGVLGIGTLTPLGIFEVKGDGVSYFTRGTKSILLNPNSVSANTNAIIDTSSSMALDLQTGGSFAARISTSQNFLIGTTTDAGNKLQVRGDAKISNSGEAVLQLQDIDGTNQYLNIAHNGANSYFLTSDNADFGKFVWYRYKASTNTLFSIMETTTDGNVLIGSGTNYGQKLYLNGSFRIDGQTSGTAGGSSGQHLIINCDGTTYKIALLNP